ncbi:MAG: hypothetical protein AABY26_01790 [Nanoarchaeota archaeon]
MDIKLWVLSRKYQIMAMLLLLALFVLVSCTTPGSAPAPSGPIGGGCG